MRDLMPFIEALQALPEGENFGEDWMDVKDVERLLVEHRIDVNEFWLLDETPGRYGYDPNDSGGHGLKMPFQRTGGRRADFHATRYIDRAERYRRE